MTAAIPDDTLVIVAGHLGRVACSMPLGNAPGYNVATPRETSRDGYAPHFAPDWCVEVAELGVNVCWKRRGQCFCGLVHIPHPEWLAGVAT